MVSKTPLPPGVFFETYAIIVFYILCGIISSVSTKGIQKVIEQNEVNGDTDTTITPVFKGLYDTESEPKPVLHRAGVDGDTLGEFCAIYAKDTPLPVLG